MKPASLHRRILFPLLLCGGLLFALLFWYFSPFFSPGENRRFSAYVEERFHSEVTSSAITLHYTLADPASRGIAPGTASFGTVSIPVCISCRFRMGMDHSGILYLLFAEPVSSGLRCHLCLCRLP